MLGGSLCCPGTGGQLVRRSGSASPEVACAVTKSNQIAEVAELELADLIASECRSFRRSCPRLDVRHTWRDRGCAERRCRCAGTTAWRAPAHLPTSLRWRFETVGKLSQGPCVACTSGWAHTLDCLGVDPGITRKWRDNHEFAGMLASGLVLGGCVFCPDVWRTDRVWFTE
jgi:hypothetical protein